MFLAIFGFAYFLLKKRRRKKVRMINLRRDGKKERQINSYTMDSKTVRERERDRRKTEIQSVRETESQRVRETDRQTERETEKHAESQIESDRHTDRK
jgi:hypothetical protein